MGEPAYPYITLLFIMEVVTAVGESAYPYITLLFIMEVVTAVGESAYPAKAGVGAWEQGYPIDLQSMSIIRLTFSWTVKISLLYCM